MSGHATIEVFADIGCPFTHVGLRRFVDRRTELDRDDVMLWVRAWPLEIVNGTPLDPHFIAEEVDDIRTQVAPDLFGGFREDTFPATSLPALALAAAAHEVGPATGERVSLALRDLLFERGVDVADEDVLRDVAVEHGVEWSSVDPQRVVDDHAEGVRRQVVGSPHFFTSAGGFFCPALQVSRDEAGLLQVVPDAAAFEQFLASCFA
jgi:predicted DsbA family dithiol-disulfide isomerase